MFIQMSFNFVSSDKLLDVLIHTIQPQRFETEELRPLIDPLVNIQ
jgi:hypothetical protein